MCHYSSEGKVSVYLRGQLQLGTEEEVTLQSGLASCAAQFPPAKMSIAHLIFVGEKNLSEKRLIVLLLDVGV